MRDPNVPDDWNWMMFDRYNSDDEDDDEDRYDREPSHPLGCICADCSGAELTAEND